MLQYGSSSLIMAALYGRVTCLDQLLSTSDINVDIAFQRIFELYISKTDPEDLEETDPYCSDFLTI